MTVGFVGGGGYDRGRGGGGGYDRGGRGGYSSGGGGGGGGFSGDSEMTTQQDTIFIQGLPTDIDERSLASFFGQIGIIKVRLLAFVEIFALHLYSANYRLYIVWCVNEGQQCNTTWNPF